jgi:hypothetical protein
VLVNQCALSWTHILHLTQSDDSSSFPADECIPLCTRGQNATELYNYTYVAEKFLPPYFFKPGRPDIVSVDRTVVPMGGMILINCVGTITHAVLMKPGAVTHQSDMGQRGIKLAKVREDIIGKKVSFRLPPPGGLVAPPGHYMLFLMNRGLPCKKATWIQLVNPTAGAPTRS